jgi:hypothetical protein
MAAGLFVIKEILPSGLPGTIFHWTADERSLSEDNQAAERGGARACPLGSWDQGGEMRSVRTDYSGNPVPSEQVLGSKEKPQGFNGRWDDRYNHKGYAQETLRSFKAMCKRGNLVEVSYQQKGYIGLIKDWSFSERRNWDVRYSFNLSIHGSIEEVEADDLGLDDFIQRSPIDFRDDTDDIISAMLITDDIAPRSHLLDGPADEVRDTMATIDAAMLSLDDSLDQRDLNVASPTNPISPFSLLGSKFRTITEVALNIQEATLQLRSDISLSIVTAKSILDFEEWQRSMRFHSRTLLWTTLQAEVSMKERDSPEVDRLYRAHEGESLMAISRAVYGTPHQWGLIYEANGLTSEVLEKPEVLIIPQLGSA